MRGLTQHVCDTEEEALNCLFEGELNRTFRQHYLNDHSSRAHCVFTIHIESRSRVESADKVVFSKLHLVDLAGSERTKKTGSNGLVLKEASYINKSLSFLEQVVLALSDKKRDHVPYRQAKLTNYLRDSLGGNCKTVMIANVWPEPLHMEETSSTLKFATRMMKVNNEAQVNIFQDPTLLIKRYEKEIKDLKQELAMHDTLANRRRINYTSYTQEQQAAAQSLTTQFLNGDRDDIGEIDSLRKVREVFQIIRTHYRKLQQNNDAMKRQIDQNPESFKQSLKENQSPVKEAKVEEKAPETNAEEQQEEQDEEQVHQKRPAIDKQVAFSEFKQTEDGQTLEQRIFEFRQMIKSHKDLIKDSTAEINNTKARIDQLKAKLDRKEQERKVRLREDQLKGDDGFDGNQEDIIDEEELVLLREMKDVKKSYREQFSHLKSLKAEFKDAQVQVDLVKE